MAVIDRIIYDIQTLPIDQKLWFRIEYPFELKEELDLAYLGFLQFHDSIRVSLINLIFIIQSPS